jgi:hypothetical protein
MDDRAGAMSLEGRIELRRGLEYRPNESTPAHEIGMASG